MTASKKPRFRDAHVKNPAPGIPATAMRFCLPLEKLGPGIAWLDTGTQETLMQASHFIQAIHQREGLKAACLKEIAFRKDRSGPTSETPRPAVAAKQLRPVSARYAALPGDLLDSNRTVGSTTGQPNHRRELRIFQEYRQTGGGRPWRVIPPNAPPPGPGRAAH